MQQQGTRTAWIVAAALGALTAILSVGSGIASYFLLSPLSNMVTVVVSGFCYIGLVSGAALLIAGVRGAQGKQALPFYSPWQWILWLAGTAALWAVGVLIPADLQTTWLFGLVHFGGILFPALLILALIAMAAGRRASLNIRQAVLALFSGAAGVWLALALEIVGVLLLAGIVFAIVYLMPGGAAEIERILQMLSSFQVAATVELEDMLPLLMSPMVAVIVVLTLSVIAPVVEEVAKTLLFLALGYWEKKSQRSASARLARAFLWGVACGIGFAIVEGVSNGALGLGTSAAWLGGVSSRALATMLHALTSGLVGLGWGWAWQQRGWRLPLMLALSIGLHGLWNFAAFIELSGTALELQSSLAGKAISIAAIVLQVIIFVINVIALFAIPLVLRRNGGDDAHTQTAA